MGIQDGQTINIQELVQRLIAAAAAHDDQETRRLDTEVGTWFSQVYGEILWLREEKRLMDGFLGDLRRGGEKSILATPTGEPNHRYLYEVKFKCEIVDNTHPDGEPV